MVDSRNESDSESNDSEPSPLQALTIGQVLATPSLLAGNEGRPPGPGQHDSESPSHRSPIPTSATAPSSESPPPPYTSLILHSVDPFMGYPVIVSQPIQLYSNTVSTDTRDPAPTPAIIAQLPAVRLAPPPYNDSSLFASTSPLHLLDNILGHSLSVYTPISHGDMPVARSIFSNRPPTRPLSLLGLPPFDLDTIEVQLFGQTYQLDARPQVDEDDDESDGDYGDMPELEDA